MSETVEEMILRYEREIANFQKYSAAYPVWRSTFKILLSLLQRIHTLESNIAKLEERLSPPKEAVRRQNMFHNCAEIGEVIRQAVGAGSAAWLEQEVNGVTEHTFDSDQALIISDDAEERIQQLYVKQAERSVHAGGGTTTAYGAGGHVSRTTCAHGQQGGAQ